MFSIIHLTLKNCHCSASTHLNIGSRECASGFRWRQAWSPCWSWRRWRGWGWSWSTLHRLQVNSLSKQFERWEMIWFEWFTQKISLLVICNGAVASLALCWLGLTNPEEDWDELFRTVAGLSTYCSSEVPHEEGKPAEYECLHNHAEGDEGLVLLPPHGATHGPPLVRAWY